MSSVKSPLDAEIVALLECPVCLERFNDPRVLPCNHTLCLTCLMQHVRAADTFHCPECRRSHDVPVAGLKAFPTNIIVNKLCDMYSGRAREEAAKLNTCSLHTGCSLTMFCETCEVAVCVMCPTIHGSHGSHTCVDLHATAVSKVADLSHCCQVLTDRLASLQGLPQQTIDVATKIKVDVFAAKERVSNMADALCRAVREEEEGLTRQLEDIKTTAVAKATKVCSQQLWQIRKLQGMKAKVNNLCDVKDDLQFVNGIVRLSREVQDSCQSILRKMQWESNVNHMERTSAIKEVLGKIEKEEQVKKSTSSIQNPTLTLEEVIDLNCKRFVSGIAVAVGHIFVSHSDSRYLWVYSKGGRFVQTLLVPHLGECSGLATFVQDGGDVFLCVSDKFSKELIWLIISVAEDHELTIHPQGTASFKGVYRNLASDNVNSTLVIAVNEPCALHLYNHNPAKTSPVISVDADIGTLSCAVGTLQGFALYSHQRKSVVFLDHNGSRIKESQIHQNKDQGSTPAVILDMCFSNLPEPVIFAADRDLNYVHTVDVEGDNHQPCALTAEDHGINHPIRVCWDDTTESLLVAQPSTTAFGYEVRVYHYGRKESGQLHKEETILVGMKLELQSLH